MPARIFRVRHPLPVRRHHKLQHWQTSEKRHQLSRPWIEDLHRSGFHPAQHEQAFAVPRRHRIRDVQLIPCQAYRLRLPPEFEPPRFHQFIDISTSFAPRTENKMPSVRGPLPIGLVAIDRPVQIQWMRVFSVTAYQPYTRCLRVEGHRKLRSIRGDRQKDRSLRRLPKNPRMVAILIHHPYLPAFDEVDRLAV